MIHNRKGDNRRISRNPAYFWLGQASSFVKSVLSSRQKTLLNHPYGSFPCKKEFFDWSKMLTIEAVRNRCFPPRKQNSAPTKTKEKRNQPTDFGRKLLIQWQTESTGKQGDTSDCSLMLSNSKSLSLGCIATSDMGLYKVCLQVPAHTFTHPQLYSIHPLQHIELPCASSLPAGLQGITVLVFTHRKNWSIAAWNLQKYHPHKKKKNT